MMVRRIGKAALLAIILAAASFIGLPPTAVAQAQAPTAAAQAPGKTLTVQRIFGVGQSSLSGSSLSGLEWSPDGSVISYYHREGEGRNAPLELWSMNTATGEHHVLVTTEQLGKLLQPPKGQPTQATGLGRAAVQNYFWSPDGRALLFASGGQMVWFDVATQQSRPLLAGEAEISDPKISPDGRWVSFMRDHNLSVVATAGGEPRQLTKGGTENLLMGELDWVYPEELDLGTAYWWSPDSQRLAYLEMDESKVTKYPVTNLNTLATETTNFPQAGEPNPIVRVGVVDVHGGETTWMDTGANTEIYLPRVDWVPDGKHVAIQRLNRAQTQLDLILADPATGETKTILTESDKYWINVTDDLHFFSDSQRFLWTSERTGHRHLYLYDVSGKLLNTLTSGDWDVSGIGGFGPRAAKGMVADEAHGWIYFQSNRENIPQSQLYRLSLKDKSITKITSGAGSHIDLIAPAANAYVDIFTTALTPPRMELFSADGKRVAVLNENKVPELAEYHLSPVEFFTVNADDGTKLYADMIKPPNFDPAKKYPVLISVYGGPHAQVVRDGWGGSNLLWHQMMAQRGFIIFSLDNRGSYGRGHVFETPLYHQFGKIELQDQLAGVRYLKSLPYVDGARIGIWGWSYGGYMTLTAMFHASDVFRAGVCVAPVSDWKLYDTIYTERYMGLPQENADGYKNSSPGNFAAGLKGKLMMVHGTGDDNVHFANTTLVLNQLIAAGKYPDELMIFPGRGHGIGDPPAHLKLFERITQFLEDELK
jgi:dipeptidyl-peptidase-4